MILKINFQMKSYIEKFFIKNIKVKSYIEKFFIKNIFERYLF